MTKGTAALPLKVVAGPKVFFISSSGPRDEERRPFSSCF
jgi:hypothetical protein